MWHGRRSGTWPVRNCPRSQSEDNEHEVVHLFLILVVLVNEVSEDEHLTRFEVVLDHLDKLARGLVVSLMDISSLHVFLQIFDILLEG